MEKTAEELQKELETERARGADNIKALQQKLTEKDQEMKKALADIEELKRQNSGDSEAKKEIEALTKTVETLTQQIGTLSTDKQREELSKKYPDILPDLLIGKTPEEAELIVNKQREITLKSYDKKPSDHEPMFKDHNEIDTEIERIKTDPKLSTTEKLRQVRELKLEKDKI